MRPWSALRSDLERRGLNAIGVADGRPYEAWLPGCRAVVVVGSGGPRLWTRFVDAVQADPSTLVAERDPLDAFVRRELAAAGGEGPGRRWVLADQQQEPAAPMQQLALQAGLGWRSRLWLVLHPVYGPWLGLRAACFTTEPLPVDGPLGAPSPCAGCAAPCAPACPGGALDAGDMDWRACTLHRAGSRDCVGACHARSACPEGAGWAYPAEEQAYHQEQAVGRRALVARLGLVDGVDVAGIDWVARARAARASLARG